MSKATYVLDAVTVEGDDDDLVPFEELPMVEDDDTDDFASVFSAIQHGSVDLYGPSAATSGSARAAPTATSSSASPAVGSTVNGRFEPASGTVAVEDFVRNFLVAHGMTRTLDAFQTEWYQQQHGHGNNASTNTSNTTATALPTIYSQYHELLQEAAVLRQTASNATGAANEAKGTWLKFKKERDTHRMHHRRLVAEKAALINDLARLKRHVDEYAPALEQLQRKYEAALKERMLLRLEKTKLLQQAATAGAPEQPASKALNPTKASAAKALPPLVGAGTAANAGTTRSAAAAAAGDRTLGATKGSTTTNASAPLSETLAALVPVSSNPYSAPGAAPARAPLQAATLAHSYPAHTAAVSGVAISPVAPVVTSVGDDKAWKVWALPQGDLIMSGEGHASWLAACDFHPTTGALLATAGGDHCAKLWSLQEQKCAVKLAGHTQPVWDVRFHGSGHSVLTASMDRTARLWDVATGKQVSAFRDHVDSVNKARWVPFSQLFVTASGDKTISVWDARAGLCVQTLVGHLNAVQALDVAPAGNAIISGDADGAVKVWDLAAGGVELVHFDLARGVAVNSVAFDPSAQLALAAVDNGRVEVLGIDEHDRDSAGRWTRLGELQTPNGVAVQDLAIAASGEFAVGGAADGQVLFWQM